MKFYRIHLYDPVDGSRGYEWFTSKQDAKKAARTFEGILEVETKLVKEEVEVEIKKVEIKATRIGILSALRQYASHPDNG